jgi:hypothetical protein
MITSTLDRNPPFVLDAPPSTSASEALQSRFALRVTAALTENAHRLNADVGERLRCARELALERARKRTSADIVAKRGSAGRLGWIGSSWWIRLASVAPVFALVAGLVLIQRWQDNSQISVAAEVDAALLSDDLPPVAYRDAGFAEFLKSPSE